MVTALAIAADSKLLIGKVVAIADGDTFTLLVDKTQYKVRLASIDAPERRQPFGKKSQQALAELVFGKTVEVDVLGKDKYKRSLGVIWRGELNINLQLVREGWAWWYRKYAPENEELAEAEQCPAPAAVPVEAVPPRAAEVRGRKRCVPKAAGGRAAPATATDTVYRIISRSRNGVDTAVLKRKTGFNDKKIHNIVYKLKKKNKIRSRRKGLYVKA